MTRTGRILVGSISTRAGSKPAAAEATRSLGFPSECREAIRGNEVGHEANLALTDLHLVLIEDTQPACPWTRSSDPQPQPGTSVPAA